MRGTLSSLQMEDCGLVALVVELMLQAKANSTVQQFEGEGLSPLTHSLYHSVAVMHITEHLVAK